MNMPFINRYTLLLVAMLCIYLLSSCSNDSETSSSSSSNPGSSSSSEYPSSSSSSEYVGGSCDINDYETVMIGEQVWMAENLNCYVAGSKCYNNDSANCATYGRLYDWATAMGIDEKYNRELLNGSDAKHQGICPSGWHIPSNEDWNILITTTINATGGSSFSALLGGDGGPDGKFANVGVAGSWWSTIEYDSNLAYFWNLIYFRENGSLGYYDGYGKRRLLSVRCLKD